MSQLNSGYIKFLLDGNETARFSFVGSDFSEERALILLEIYLKQSVWRTSAIGQGFHGGLDALVEHFGGTLNDSISNTPSIPTLLENQSKITASLEKDSTFDRKLVELIMSIKISGNNFYRVGSIPEKKEKNARASLQIPTQDRIYALVDTTIFGSAKEGAAICSSGIYWKGTSENKIGFLGYSDLVQSEIKTGWFMSLSVESQFGVHKIDLNGSDVDKNEFCALIKQIINIYCKDESSQKIAIL